MEILKIVVILLVFSSVTAASRPQKQLFASTSIERLECYNDALQCVDLTCQRLDLGNYKYNFTIGCRLLKSCSPLRVRLYNPKLFDSEFNMCQITEITQNPILKTFLPGVIEQFKPVLHECPYKDRLSVENVTIDGTLVRSFRKAAYKNEYSFRCGKLMPFLKVTVYGH